MTFQFQTGAIKRKEHAEDAVRGASSFNSKLVRLKVCDTISSRKARFSFQFQTGAIKSCCPSAAANTPITGFNSKLVRLKATAVLADEAHESGFNSKLVRLKGEDWTIRNLLAFAVSIPNWCD